MARKEKLNKITQIANNEEAAVALFNENVDKVNRAIEDSLSISGKDPNVMRTPLDMGEQPIINAKMRNIADRMDGDVVLWGEVKDFGSATNRAETAAKEAEAWKNETQDIAKTLEDKLRDELAANYVKNNTKASGSLAMGEGASTSRADDIIIGKNASDEGSSQGLNIVIGTGAKALSNSANSVSIGSAARSTLFGTAIGASARASGINAVALGVNSLASGAGSIQIGAGSNSEAESLYVYLGTQTDLNGDGVAEEWVGNNYKLLGKDGKIPAERLPALSYTTQADLQNVREDFMDSDNDLQIQLNGQAAVLEEVKDDCMANLSEIADLKTSKQDKLIAGSNIQIVDNVISAIGGGGSGGDVDLTGYLKNTATGDYSISVLGTPSDQAYAINMGVGTTSAADSVAIGHTASAAGEKSLAIGTSVIANGLGSITLGYSTRHLSGAHGIAIGYNAQTSGENTIQLGQGTNTTANTFQVGSYRMLDANGKIPAARLPDDIGGGADLTGYIKNKSTAGFAIGPDGSYLSSGTNSISIGYGDSSSQVTSSGSSAIAIGTYANASGNYGVSIGGSSSATGQFSVGLGYAAKAGASYAIQLGQGTNNTANTLKVGLASKNYTLLNSDGTIPAERLVNTPAPDLSECQKKLTAGKGISVTEGGENYSVVGTIAVDSNKVASGFNTRASYLSAPNVIFDESTVSGHSGFEMVIAFEVSSVSSSGSLFTVSTASSATTFATGLRIYNGKLSAFCGSSSSTIQGTTALTANTKVYAKLKYDDGAGYTLQYSTNGTTWSNEATLAETSIAASLNSEMYIGYTAATSGGLKVYLPETYVTVDNKEVWRASKPALVAADSSWIATQTMPSTKYTNLTLGATGSTFAAPATGWVYLDKKTAAANQSITVTNTTLAINNTSISPAAGTCRILVPIQKGHTFAVHYTAAGEVTIFRFYYAE